MAAAQDQTETRIVSFAAMVVALAVHVATGADGAPVVDRAWVDQQVAEANRLFAAAGLSFEIASVDALPATAVEITTRAQRDQLGRGRERGAEHVFVVARLADVDVPEDRRGVHWRDRADRARCWIILAKIAPPMVLAHELGHHFGLPHSTDPVSLMNKTPRAEPPLEERRFTGAELQVIRRTAARRPAR